MMPIEHHKSGITITGDSLTYWHWCQMKYAVSLECKGIRINRGRVVWKIAKKHLKMEKGDKHAVLVALTAKVAELQKQQEHVTEEGKRIVDGMEVQ